VQEANSNRYDRMLKWSSAMSMRAKLLLAMSVVVVTAGTIAGVVAAQSGGDSAADAIDAIAARGPDNAIVATVNGRSITRRTVDVVMAVGAAGASSGFSGRPIDGMTREDVLEELIDGILLAQAAEEAGVVVTEDEVTQAINAGFVYPLKSESTPPDLKRVLQAELNLAGLTVDDVVLDPDMRRSYREFLLVNRWASETKVPRDERLAAARAVAKIEVFPAVLNAEP
jgi:hypothetical protein